MPGRHDVQDGQPLDGLWVIQDQPVRDPAAAIVADQAEPAEAELAHQPDLVPRHEPLGVHAACFVRLGLGRVSVAAQVSHDDGVVAGQAGGDLPPYQVVLRVAVQQQQRRARPGDGAVDGDAGHVHATVIEAGQHGRGHDGSSCSSRAAAARGELLIVRSWSADARCVPAGSQASRCSFSQPSADTHVVEARRRIHGEDARRRPPAYRTVSTTVGIAWGVVSTAAYDGASASISMMSRKMSGGWSSSVRRSHAVSTGRGPPAYGRLPSVGRTSKNWSIGTSPGGIANRSQLPCGGTNGQSGATGCNHWGLAAPVTSEAEARHNLSPSSWSASAEARPRRGRVIATVNTWLIGRCRRTVTLRIRPASSPEYVALASKARVRPPWSPPKPHRCVG